MWSSGVCVVPVVGNAVSGNAVVLSLRFWPTAPPIHCVRILDSTRCPVQTSPHILLNQPCPLSATPHPLSHNIALHPPTLAQPLHESSPSTDTAPRPPSETTKRSVPHRLR
ncbi:hypothetical protein EJ07DRAFT_156964 [Lizonia empirigonia]|nr:hypothetical protein EJ07DRAFT_156964 [Lizonia empirigonia]